MQQGPDGSGRAAATAYNQHLQQTPQQAPRTDRPVDRLICRTKSLIERQRSTVESLIRRHQPDNGHSRDENENTKQQDSPAEPYRNDDRARGK